MLAVTERLRISVVTPSFNMARYLEETIVSVLGNLAPGDEYFIIDGGSTDGSLDIIRKYQHRITGWVSEPDRGYADAIGKGFARSTGDILCWVNASDLLAPHAFERIRDGFKAARFDFVYGDALNIDESSMVLWKSPAVFGDMRRHMLYAGGAPWQIACFWRRSAYESIGGIRADLKYAADYDLFLRLCMATGARHVPAVLGAHRYHPGQLSVAGSDQYLQEKLAVQREALGSVRGWAAAKAVLRVLYWGIGKIQGRIAIMRAAWDSRRGTPLSSSTDWLGVGR